MQQSTWCRRACTKVEKLPYTIGNGCGALSTRTISMCARHFNDTLAWDVHNLYGVAEGIVTAKAVANITMQRPFILSRCTLPVIMTCAYFHCASRRELSYDITLDERVLIAHPSDVCMQVHLCGIRRVGRALDR